MNELLAHLFGDYVCQTDQMATEKTKRWAPAVVHGITYTLPFVALTRSPARLAVIAGTHVVIDHYRLAKRLVWAKEQLAPAERRYSWGQAGPFGYRKDKPDWMAFWLMVAADNSCHLLINRLVLGIPDKENRSYPPPHL